MKITDLLTVPNRLYHMVLFGAIFQYSSCGGVKNKTNKSIRLDYFMTAGFYLISLPQKQRSLNFVSTNRTVQWCMSKRACHTVGLIYDIYILTWYLYYFENI